MNDFRARVAKHAALADPARLRIVDLLTLGDLSPTELQAELGMPSNLLSHHLRTLEDAGLATRHRSEADKRRSYIRLAAGALEGLVPGVEHGCPPRPVRLHPQQRPVPAGRRALAPGQRNPLDLGGNAPRGPHRPGAVEVARRHGVDLADIAPAPLDEVAASGRLRRDRVRQRPRGTARDLGGVHWSVPDPLRLGTEDAFERAFDDIAHRISDLAPRLHAA